MISVENEAVFEYLTQVNDISEWMWSIYFKYAAAIIFSPLNLALVSAISCFLNHGEFNIDYAYQANRMVYLC